MTGIASVYGQALYDLARSEDLDNGIGEELKVLKDVFLQNQDFVRLVSTPSLPKAERLEIIHNSFSGKVHPYVLNFMKILTEKGYMHAFASCCDVYRGSYNADHGILPVKATTAVSLSEEQAERLQRKLADITGKQIELTNVVDPGCMGGVRLDYDGKRVDDTVRGRLDRVHNLLKNTIL